MVPTLLPAWARSRNEQRTWQGWSMLLLAPSPVNSMAGWARPQVVSRLTTIHLAQTCDFIPSGWTVIMRGALNVTVHLSIAMPERPHRDSSAVTIIHAIDFLFMILQQ